MDEKIYKCECGKEFTKPNSFNAHKSNCRTHYASTGKDLAAVYRSRGCGISKTLSERSKQLKESQLQQWIEERHACEKCGKVMSEKYATGRFCSRECANSHVVTDEHKTKTSNTLTGANLSVEEYLSLHSKVDTHTSEFECSVCGRYFKNIVGLRGHENRCKRKHNIPVFVKIGNVELDISENDLVEYMSQHKTCEICGKSVDEAVKYTGKQASKRLCVDHDHVTNKFRGMLCQVCNRQLGWYERYKAAVDSYLNKE